MGESGNEISYEPVIDFTSKGSRQKKVVHTNQNPVIDFTRENLPPKRDANRKGKGVVGKSQDSWLARSARSKLLGATLAASSLAGGVKAYASETNGQRRDDGVKVTLLTRSAEVKEPEVGKEELKKEGFELFDTVFHDLTPEQHQEASAWVNEFVERLRVKPGYDKQHREIPQKYKEIIAQTADAYGLPYEMLYGIIAIENGGGEDITNQVSGATGVAQFLPDTARQYKLTVTDEVDQRADPVLSIDAAGRYLRDHMAFLGNDAGLAMWSYHAGIGNVNEALSVYFRDKYGEDIGFDNGNVDVAKTRELIRKDKLDFFKLSSNPAVKAEVISRLHDFSETYVPSVLAILKLEHERETHDLGDGLKVSVPKDIFPGR